MSVLIPSVSSSQDEILKNILLLHCGGKFDCDPTYGRGNFYKSVTAPKLKFDLTPLVRGVKKANSEKLPLKSTSLSSIVFDPPFLTYIRAGRRHNSIMAKGFSGYWSYKDLETHYGNSLREFHRVLCPAGIVVFKCQDIIHNHRMHCTHANILNWAENLFRLRDLFILTRDFKMPVKAASHGKQKQQHARVHHSYFLVLEKLK